MQIETINAGIDSNNRMMTDIPVVISISAKRKPKNKAVTFSFVWDLYLNTLARDKAPATVTKHTSVWENHIKDNFGSKFMTGAQAVSVLEINDYLSKNVSVNRIVLPLMRSCKINHQVTIKCEIVESSKD